MTHRNLGNRCRTNGLQLALFAAILSIAAFDSVPALAQSQTPTELPGGATPTVPSSTGAAPQQSIGATQSPGPSTSQQSASVPSFGADTGNLVFMELREFTNQTRVTGPGASLSFLTPGYNNAVDLNFLQTMTSGIHRFEYVTVGRYTDDPRYDPEHNSLQRAYLRISSPSYELNFGDYLVSYTRFTYNQNVKGFNLTKREPWGSGFSLMANGGVFIDRYGSLWNDTILGKPFTRIVGGMRAEQKIAKDKLFALNWSYGSDIANSIPVDPVTGTQAFIPVQGNVLSVDSRMTFFKRWDMQGEAAYSMNNFDTRLPNANLPYNPACAKADPVCKDYAVRFDNTMRLGAWNFGEYYTRIMPSFYAENARQVADLQDILARAGVQVSKRISVVANYRRTNNDLRGDNAIPETVFQLPEVHATVRDLPGLGNTLIDVGYRERHQQEAGIASQVTRAPYAEVGIPISSSMVTVGFEHRFFYDHATPSNNTSTNDVSASFRSIFNVGNWMFTPLFRYQLNREMYYQYSAGNDNRSMIASLILDAPKYFVLEGSWRQVGATLFLQAPQLDNLGNPLLTPVGAPVYGVVPGSNGYNRPSLHAAITFKINNNGDRTISVSYDNNRNWYAPIVTGGVATSQNFYERVIQISFLWRFRKKG